MELVRRLQQARDGGDDGDAGLNQFKFDFLNAFDCQEQEIQEQRRLRLLLFLEEELLREVVI